MRKQKGNENKRIGLGTRTQNRNENYFNSLLGLLKKWWYNWYSSKHTRDTKLHTALTYKDIKYIREA